MTYLLEKNIESKNVTIFNIDLSGSMSIAVEGKE
jgi:hypothetical protein